MGFAVRELYIIFIDGESDLFCNGNWLIWFEHLFSSNFLQKI